MTHPVCGVSLTATGDGRDRNNGVPSDAWRRRTSRGWGAEDTLSEPRVLLGPGEEDGEAGRTDTGTGQKKDTNDRVQQLNHLDSVGGVHGPNGEEVPGGARATPGRYLQ